MKIFLSQKLNCAAKQLQTVSMQQLKRLVYLTVHTGTSNLAHYLIRLQFMYMIRWHNLWLYLYQHIA